MYAKDLNETLGSSIVFDNTPYKSFYGVTSIRDIFIRTSEKYTNIFYIFRGPSGGGGSNLKKVDFQVTQNALLLGV